MQKPAVNSKRQVKGQMKKNNLVFIQNYEFRILSLRLMTIDRKSTNMFCSNQGEEIYHVLGNNKGAYDYIASRLLVLP